MAEYNDREWQEKLKQDRLDHIRKTSPTLLQRLQKAFNGKSAAEAALADATAALDLEARLQSQYNLLYRRREEFTAKLEKLERLLKSLPADIQGWERKLREHLIEDGVLAETQKHHAAAQIAILRVMQEQLPATIKTLRGQIVAHQKEMAALQTEAA